MVQLPLKTVVPHTISAASIGIPDTFFLMLLALIVFGPRRLPEIGRQIGKLMYEFRKVSNDFKFQMEEELRASEEADRVRKMEAVQAIQAPVDVARLDVPPQQVLEAQPLAITDGAISAGSPIVGSDLIGSPLVEESAASIEGEVRAEAPAALAIQPPASGETIAAQKPFRHRVPEIAPEPVSTHAPEPATESGDIATREITEPLVLTGIADEGRTGTEVQLGLENTSATSRRAEAAEQELHHG